MHKTYSMLLMLCMSAIVTCFNCTIIQAQAQYSGEVKLNGISQEIKVYFDRYGIPHVYAQNEEDAYFALGYLQAQERLGQLELYRRLSTGRLAEIIGKKGIASDQMMRTIGITENARKSAKLLQNAPTSRFKKITLAYLAGVNEYVATGKTPLEFEILNISRKKFTLVDMYAVSGLLAFQLALGFRSELVLDKIRQKLGDEYLKDLESQFGSPVTPGDEKHLQKGSINKYHYLKGESPVSPQLEKYKLRAESKITQGFKDLLNVMPGIGRWMGSNAWLLSGKKTRKNKVIFCNDTHLGVAQPGIWFEAHINFPQRNLYGYLAPLLPFFVVGHNNYTSFGNTSLLVDDLDFYREKYKPGSHYQILQDDKWVNLTLRQETIKVKGGQDVKLIVRSSRRGPIINDIVPGLTKSNNPVSMFWVYNKFPNKFVEFTYRLSNSRNLQEAKKAASINVAPSLNVMYGDKQGNIAWWASARLINRKPGVNSKFILDGSNSKNEPFGYYDFSQNPSSINPASGFITSANNQPDKVNGALYPGYYVAGVRKKRLSDIFKQDKKWSSTELKALFMDDTSPLFVKISQEVLTILQDDAVLVKSPNHVAAVQMLKKWDGSHGTKEQAPVVFSRLLYYLIKHTMEDELGTKLFAELMPGGGFMNEILSRTYPKLFFKQKSVWWNNVNTNERKESRKDIFALAFDQAIEELSKQYPNTKDWRWGNLHQITYINFTQDKRFTVGPFKMSGGMDVVNKFGFALSNNKVHNITDQPAQRMMVDFSDKENKSWGILPMGNSGHPRSIFYKDQAKMYNKGQLRRQLTNKWEIQRVGSLLRLKVR